jgi:hypothetical protein
MVDLKGGAAAEVNAVVSSSNPARRGHQGSADGYLHYRVCPTQHREEFTRYNQNVLHLELEFNDIFVQ